MIYHVLNGDSLASGFDLEGEIVVCREALIEGNLRAKNLNELWKVRAEFFNDDSYFEKVKGEFDKLNNVKFTDEVNLWFGDEAFCQVNLWFVLWLIWDKKPDFYRVYPDSGDWNCTFQNLEKCFKNRQKLSWDEVRWGGILWQKFQADDFGAAAVISRAISSDLPNLKYLDEVCQALIEKNERPREVLRQITEFGENDFAKIFPQFRAKAGIYGFGDTQVKNLLNEI